jgi:hypothetical protein
MTKASITVTQLISTVGLLLIPGGAGPKFGTVLQVIGFGMIFIPRLALLLPDKEASRFGATVLKGKIVQFDNLYVCKEWLIAVPSKCLDGSRRRRFSDLWPLVTSLEVF